MALAVAVVAAQPLQELVELEIHHLQARHKVTTEETEGHTQQIMIFNPVAVAALGALVELELQLLVALEGRELHHQ